MIQLTWIDQLLDNIKTLFVELYGEQLKKPYTSVVECHNFDSYFDQQVRELEGGLGKDSEQQTPQLRVEDLTPPSSSENGDEPPPPIPGFAPSVGGAKQSESATTSTDSTPIPTPDTSRPSTPASHILGGKAGPKGASRRARKAASGVPAASSGDERKGKVSTSKKDTTKKMRRWDDAGMVDEGDGSVLDYSAQSPPADETVEDFITAIEPVDVKASGTRTGKGQYVLKDLDHEVHSILQKAKANKSSSLATSKEGLVTSSLSTISGLFRNVIGGKTITKTELDKALKNMETHLLNKNVAHEAAVRLCQGVEKELVDTKTASFESVDASIRAAMSSALHKILTPTTSLDILRSVGTVTAQGRPYVISIVGVNGVGKSTNLSKLAFFLLQNNLSLLIAACDTFRSGAVEQLRVHARNLQELSSREGRGSIELYERGYGKDAANIARDAIAYAASRSIDVVLIDTAGRRHNDARLMSSLEKFATLAQPDKILMVGEALVGSDSVAQARSFNAAFGPKRGLDGFIISKCDTVGEMVGTLVSMVHATGIPVVFLGTGQHYGDLRTLSVDSTVGLLMS